MCDASGIITRSTECWKFRQVDGWLEQVSSECSSVEASELTIIRTASDDSFMIRESSL